MNYVTIINLIFLILGISLSIYLFHFVIFAVSGIVHRKRFPVTEEKCRYGVLVSAKDEENVIPRLINSVREAGYPQDKIDIFIVAHNCQDKTAEIAKSMGANVIVYNDENAKVVGYAYHYAFSRINVKDYDGFIVLNADNTVKHDFFDKINDSFVYFDKKKIVTTYRHALNIKDGVMPVLYSYYFASLCTLSFAGRENLNVSSHITGCGFVIPSFMLENGWSYFSITEDLEASNDKIINGESIHYCDDAIFYDEQPRTFKTMWNQRMRWSKGQRDLSVKYYPKFLKALFSKEGKDKKSLYTALTFCSSIPLLFFSLFIFQFLFILLSPLFCVSYQETFLYWNNEVNWFTNMFMSLRTGYLFTFAKSIVTYFIYSFLASGLSIIASRGKYKKQPKFPLIGAFFVFSFFILLQIPLDICAIFVKNVKWVKIPHGEQIKK